MAIHPFYSELQSAKKNMNNGNYGLWYNKFIPLSDRFKASDENGKDTAPVEYYEGRYKQMKNNAAELLKQKHLDMSAYCKTFSRELYEIIIIKATLKTPLITGIGESHPHEISLVFDHNLGIPYIPASGVKGIVRFAHTLSFIPEAEKLGKVDKEEFDDEAPWTLIPLMFGTQKQRGKVVFLDAYSEKVPELKIDIMNPHYGDYYSDKEGRTPPADYLPPNPIKFLTVAPGTTFIFRSVTKKEGDLPAKVSAAFIKALTEEGVGAKTAIGYGRFIIPETEGSKSEVIQDTSLQLDKLIREIQSLNPSDAGRIGSIIDKALKELESHEEKRKFAEAVRYHMGKDFKKSKAKGKLEKYLTE